MMVVNNQERHSSWFLNLEINTLQTLCSDFVMLKLLANFPLQSIGACKVLCCKKTLQLLVFLMLCLVINQLPVVIVGNKFHFYCFHISPLFLIVSILRHSYAQEVKNLSMSSVVYIYVVHDKTFSLSIVRSGIMFLSTMHSVQFSLWLSFLYDMQHNRS